VNHVSSILALFLIVSDAVLVRAADSSDPGRQSVEKGQEPRSKTVLVIHGGAGVLTLDEMKKAGRRREDYEAVLAKALSSGHLVLMQNGKTGVDAVEAAIRVMEDSKLFNAGGGAVLNHDGRAELDAAIMEGKTDGDGEGKANPRKRAGAVTGVTHVKNPISAARAVMEMEASQHVMLAGDGADRFALREENRRRYRIEEVSNVYFWTDRQLEEIRAEIAKERGQERDTTKGRQSRSERDRRDRLVGADRRLGTVGAVALDGRGTLAAGTSTGGLTNKLPGRVSDTSIIGAGTYADNRACGVSCTGTGELFIRHSVAHDVVARMLYGKTPVVEATRLALKEVPDEEGGVGGLIALDKDGHHAFAMSARSVGMYRGYITQEGEVYVAIFKEEENRIVKPRGD
jgi:beta-aspartyl-peptidase (threonine type)